jgi:hypothetical protein
MATTDSAEQLPRPDPNAFVHQIRAQRHSRGRDLKVVITQRDSETGGGKTTAAVWLALCWDEHGWDGSEKGMTDPERFLETFPDLPKHSCLVLDEAEELDARRAMQDENIEFSKKWMKMRVRQIDSILTLPTSTALDVRIKELADIRIHVTGRGRAKVYRVTVDDRSQEVDERFIEFWSWPDVSDHAEYYALSEAKEEDLDETGDETRDWSPKEAVEDILEKGIEDRFIRQNNGSQRYIDKDAIGGEYGLAKFESKQAKSLLLQELDDDEIM